MSRNNLICVIGMNTFGLAVANNLKNLGKSVMVIDENDSTINKLNNQFETTVCADATDVNALRSLGVQDLDIVIVAVRSFETSVYICNNLHELKVPNIYAYANSSVQSRILVSIGVTNVITPEIDSAQILASQLASHTDVNDTFIGSNYSLIKVFVNKVNSMSIEEVYDKLPFVQIIGLKRGNRIILATILQKVQMGDILYAACESTLIPQLMSFFYKEPISE